MRKLYVFQLAIATLFAIVSIACSNDKKKTQTTDYLLEADAAGFVMQFFDNRHDTLLLEVLGICDSLAQNSAQCYFDFFLDVWESKFSHIEMHTLFQVYRDGVNDINNNKECVALMKDAFSEATEQSMKILKLRLQQAGALNISVEKTSKWGQIALNTDSVLPIDRLSHVLTGTGNLSVYETYNQEEIFQYFSTADMYLAETPELLLKSPTSHEESYEYSNLEQRNNDINTPLFDLLILDIVIGENGNVEYKPGCVIGYCKKTLIADLLYYLQLEELRKLFPRDMLVAWMPSSYSQSDEEYYEIITLKTHRDGKPVFTGEYIVSANSENNNGNHYLNLEFDDEGAYQFKRIIQQNVNKSLAIVIDGRLIAYPMVLSEIDEGKISISAGFSAEEAFDMALILGSGALPLTYKLLSN